MCARPLTVRFIGRRHVADGANRRGVGHQLEWITRSAKDVDAVLCDYRNYVHQEKERSHGVVIGPDDATMLWGITKSLVQQLLASTK